MTKRVKVELNRQEWSDYCGIRPIPGEAFLFWKSVADDRGLDPRSLFSADGTARAVSGLTNGHDKHWCWPSPLECKHKPRAA